MEYRELKKLGIKTSLLGFGCMRFPTTADGKIDEPEAEKMLDKAYAAGVNYFDTAYPYHNGESELVVGRAMKKYDRSSFFLATKLPVWFVNTKEDVDKYFNEQLEKLQTDYIDFYLLHAMNKERFDKMVEIGCIDRLKELKAEGKIRYVGFSFHDALSTFEEMINYTDWDFCQIQYNYMDIDDQAGDKGYEMAAKLDIPLIIMEPVKGGTLANFKEDIVEKFKAMDPSASPASYALRWVGSHENVKVVLSGMTSMEQLDDNLSTFESFKPLSEAEEKGVAEIRDLINSRIQNGCTGCRYCVPCPAGVDIPGCFSAWNQYHMFQNFNAVSWKWNVEIGPDKQPAKCVKCGLCETKCPQHISIRENLERAQADLDAAKNA